MNDVELIYCLFTGDQYRWMNALNALCLRQHITKFSKITCVIVTDDMDDYRVINACENRIISMGVRCDISFAVRKKTEFSYSQVFYDYIATRLANLGNVMFAHNLYYGSGEDDDKGLVVFSAYHFMLSHFMWNLSMITDGDSVCSGMYLTNEMIEGKDMPFFVNGFMLLNCQRIYDIIGDSVPPLSDDRYADKFIGLTCNDSPITCPLGGLTITDGYYGTPEYGNHGTLVDYLKNTLPEKEYSRLIEAYDTAC